eukprot:PhM_4_TR16798/c0_g1_i4/m.50486
MTSSVPFYVRAWRYFYLDTLLPSDSPLTRLRKLLIAFMIAINGFILIGVMLGAYSIYTGEVAVGMVRIIVLLISSLVMSRSWWYLKQTKLVNANMLDMSLFCVHAIALSHVLGTPDMDLSSACPVFFFIAAISQQHFIQHFVAWLTLALIMSYNVTIGAERNQFLALTNKTSPTYQHVIIDRGIGVLGLFIFFSGFVHKLITELDALTRRSQTALDITREIGAALVSYDTDVAMCALAAYKTNVDNDDDMCANMEQIIGNLETYRPFLPNYLLMKVSSSEEGKDEDDNGEEGDDDNSTSRNSSNSYALDVSV